ncbi:hypothetical protein [Nocardioides ferulae]|uniref:hypothetical protein n=1 Tax=Nocardioides ferulae TaxID=2340821 RepID=UPI0013DE24AF|nr:hypothetical protein [Nocardioides ferulae]
MSALTVPSLLLRAAEETHHEVDKALSWGIGVLTLVILMALLLGLLAFGKGREHS